MVDRTDGKTGDWRCSCAHWLLSLRVQQRGTRDQRERVFPQRIPLHDRSLWIFDLSPAVVCSSLPVFFFFFSFLPALEKGVKMVKR